MANLCLSNPLKSYTVKHKSRDLLSRTYNTSLKLLVLSLLFIPGTFQVQEAAYIA